MFEHEYLLDFTLQAAGSLKQRGGRLIFVGGAFIIPDCSDLKVVTVGISSTVLIGDYLGGIIYRCACYTVRNGQPLFLEAKHVELTPTPKQRLLQKAFEAMAKCAANN